MTAAPFTTRTVALEKTTTHMTPTTMPLETEFSTATIGAAMMMKPTAKINAFLITISDMDMDLLDLTPTKMNMVKTKLANTPNSAVLVLIAVMQVKSTLIT